MLNIPTRFGLCAKRNLYYASILDTFARPSSRLSRHNKPYTRQDLTSLTRHIPMSPTTAMASTNRNLHTEMDKTKKYTFLAETTPHLATILGFPSRCSTFPALYTRTCTEIIDLACTIAAFEPVRLHVRPEDISQAQNLISQHLETNSARDKPTQTSNITIVPVATNHCWVRDTGPVYVRSLENPHQRFAIDFRFCEWGNKIEELLYNNSVDKEAALAEEGVNWPIMDLTRREENTLFARRVLEIENQDQIPGHSPITRVESSVRLEGGGIEMDGEGTFMAAESSVLVPSRNEGLSREDVEAELTRLLGIKKFIWIPGREGLDITDCHIDAEARFVRPGVVVVCKPHAKCKAVWWDIYHEAREILDAAIDAQGRKLEVYDIEEPDPDLVKGDVAGEEDGPAASYVNFYFVNGGLVIPAFGDIEADMKALEIMKRLVPERQVRQVAVNALPRTGGVLHCTTQQVL